MLKNDKPLEYSKTLIQGVEIKRCKNAEYAYKSHIHNELSLGYIVEGETELSFNEETIRFEKGDGVLIPPLRTHQCVPENIEHWAYVMLYIDPEYYKNAVRFSDSKKLDQTETKKLICFIDELLCQERKEVLEHILIEMLIEFGDEDIEDTTIIEDEQIAKVHHYILRHPEGEISLDSLQQQFGLNKFVLIRQFKKRFGATPAAFHLQNRIAKAKQLLSEGAQVLDICATLGFYDQAHFIREFKKTYGITPSHYVRQLKG